MLVLCGYRLQRHMYEIVAPSYSGKVLLYTVGACSMADIRRYDGTDDFVQCIIGFTRSHYNLCIVFTRSLWLPFRDTPGYRPVAPEVLWWITQGGSRITYSDICMKLSHLHTPARCYCIPLVHVAWRISADMMAPTTLFNASLALPDLTTIFVLFLRALCDCLSEILRDIGQLPPKCFDGSHKVAQEKSAPAGMRWRPVSQDGGRSILKEDGDLVR